MQTKSEMVKKQLADQRQVLQLMETGLSDFIAKAAETIAGALSSGKKLLIMGNGGSAADAQHFAAEIVGRFKMERKALPAIALTTDTSALTAIGNDYGFDRVFSRQVEAFAQPGDVVVGISTSGNSPNVAIAMQTAKDAGCRTIALLGKDGGSIKDVVEQPLIIPSSDTPRIQEGHIITIHIICDLMEKAIFTNSSTDM